MNMRCRVGVITLAICVLAGLSSGQGAARDRGDVPKPKVSGLQEVEVLAAYLDPATQTPVILLRGKRDRRSFPMVIGPAEFNAIALALRAGVPVLVEDQVFDKAAAAGREPASRRPSI